MTRIAKPSLVTPAATLFLLCVGLFADATRASTREVYVWQRQSSPELSAAMRAFAPQVDSLCVLAAEVSWKNGEREVVRPDLDFPTLKASGRPVGLALRIGAYAGPFAANDAAARGLAAVAARLLAQARTAGLNVAELQVDFDAAESKLTGYRAWLGALRAAVGKTPLVFTALPAWLKQAEFKPLARTADGFILQVHSLEKPAGPDLAFTLCDPERALRWARQAGEAGVPFRVALPTYGYVLAFDRNGKFLALVAEGRRPTWPAGTRLRVVRADAPAMARLARTLATEPPPQCTGVIWFRLPVASDRLNWDPATLAVVLRGEVPARRLEVRVAWPEPGLAEVRVFNAGQTTESLPAMVQLRWPERERVLAADGLGGFRLDIPLGKSQADVRAADVGADTWLAPGHDAQIAWLRFAHEIALDASLPPPP